MITAVHYVNIDAGPKCEDLSLCPKPSHFSILLNTLRIKSLLFSSMCSKEGSFVIGLFLHITPDVLSVH